MSDLRSQESTICECGHSKLVHLHRCQIKGCRKCKGFKPLQHNISADTGADLTGAILR